MAPFFRAVYSGMIYLESYFSIIEVNLGLQEDLFISKFDCLTVGFVFPLFCNLTINNKKKK
jgi:hypothetical protein